MEGNIRNFIKNDTYRNIDVHRDHHAKTINETAVKVPIGQVPFGTTVHTYKLGLTLDAKLDRESLGITKKIFPRNKTDTISFEAPDATRPF